jgi:hypothetical protein
MRLTAAAAQHPQVATVYNARPAEMGSVAGSGHVFNVSGEHVGTIGLDGRVFTPHGTILGWVSPSGHLADFRRIVLTQVQADGHVRDRGGRYIGRITREVSLQQAAGAALLLLPVENLD